MNNITVQLVIRSQVFPKNRGKQPNY